MHQKTKFKTIDNQDQPTVLNKLLAVFLTLIKFSIIIIVLLVMVLAIFIKSQSGVAGYYPSLMESARMEPRLPEHALIITKEIPLYEFAVGDDITYRNINNKVVSRRVVKREIDDGSLQLKTLPLVNHRESTKETVKEFNLIGKVVKVCPSIGYIMSFILSDTQKLLFVLLSFYILGNVIHSILELQESLKIQTLTVDRKLKELQDINNKISKTLKDEK